MSMTARFILGLIIIAASYFVGSISPATILGKMHGIDIRKEGSGNPGTTNVLRVLGKKQAAITLIVDLCKGMVCVFVGMLISPAVAYTAGAMALIGHCFPWQFKFKGGKGVATGIGIMFAVKPSLALILLLIFVIVVAITRYVSLGSIIATFVMTGLSLYMIPGFFGYGVILAAIIITKHRANIGRLIRGEESKLSFGGRKTA